MRGWKEMGDYKVMFTGRHVRVGMFCMLGADGVVIK